MILFHGSNVPVREINLSKCRPYKDFGRGFYLTNIEYKTLTNQYSFHTEKAIKYLTAAGGGEI